MPADKKKMITEFVTEYGDSVLRMCYLYLKDYQLAEDVTQETFFQVYKKYDSFMQKSSVKTWIMRIAINLCKNQMRTSWFKIRKVDEFPELSYSEDYNGAIDRERLLMGIGNLRPKYKEVILLYYYQELSVAEIAKVLGQKESTVRVRLKRAREQLKEELKEDYFDE
ncbi:sigma-70 family RNA polymerase sigma factor [Roseburia hominis]